MKSVTSQCSIEYRLNEATRRSPGCVPAGVGSVIELVEVATSVTVVAPTDALIIEPVTTG